MSILFCTPCYGGMVTAQHFRACMNLKEELTKCGLEHDWLIGWNESLVHRARNEMTATFLDSQHTHMMWIDADIEFVPEDIAKLWNMQADIAVGVYAMKKRDEQLYAAWIGGQLVKDLDPFNEPVAVDFAGTGFMMIDRKVIERLAHEAVSYDGPNGRVAVLYDTPVYNDGFESEDYHFCRLAREAGFSVMMDPSVRLKHWGQFAYGA